MKDKMSLEGFIGYAKKACGIDISLVKGAGPLTFSEIFGGSFIQKETLFIKETVLYNQNKYSYNYCLIQPPVSDSTILTDLDAA